MKASEFKQQLKSMKSSLKGLTLQLITPNAVRPYSSLQSFGLEILKLESQGNSFSVNQAWTTEGIVTVTSLTQLAQLFVTKTITGIQFGTYSEHSGNATYNMGSLD